MMSQKINSFNQKLLELSQWQIEQSQKLKEFQETQKKLINDEYGNQLKNLNVQKSDYKNDMIVKDDSNKENNFAVLPAVGLFDSIKQHQFLQHNVQSHDSKIFPKAVTTQNQSCCERTNTIDQSSVRVEKKEFLKRGDGLARFRMTLEDFRHPPKIYKNLQLKTMFHKKLNNGLKNTSTKSVCAKKTGKEGSGDKEVSNVQKKKPNISVDIYVSENKSAKNNLAVNCNRKLKSVSDQKKILGRTKEVPATKLCKPFNEKCEKENHLTKSILKAPDKYFNESFYDPESEKKIDEKELRVFEILEEKVNDGNSFCSSPSLFDRLLLEEFSDSTAAKSKTKNLQKKIESSANVMNYRTSNKSPDEKGRTAVEYYKNNENIEEEKVCEDKSATNKKNIAAWEEVNEKNSVNDSHHSDETEKIVLTDLEPKSTDNTTKKLSDEYANGLKFSFYEGAKLEKACNEAVSWPKNSISQIELKPLDKKEMAMKLRRKGLQDNVKQLMNWDCSPRKKSFKKVVKKVKPKSRKKTEHSQEQAEKVVFSSVLLKDRLSELEKEIMAFRREKSAIEKLRKECLDEKNKLLRERREFEKQMREEKEKFEVKMAEDRKKLQKDRNVFDTYCKQTNNRSTRQEREEIGQLKKQLEKATETFATKEARWAASQARLRNQIRSLEKENQRLTAECEKLKKSNVQCAISGREKNFSAKVIRVINSELEKLKFKASDLGYNCHCQQSQPASERLVRSVLKEPLRRIKSAPNIKRNVSSIKVSKADKNCDMTNCQRTVITERCDSNDSNACNQPVVDGSFSCSSFSSCLSRNHEKNSGNIRNRFSESSFKKTEKDSDDEIDFISNAVEECLFEDDKMKVTNLVESSVEENLEKLKFLTSHSEEDLFSPTERLENNQIEETIDAEKKHEKFNAYPSEELAKCHFTIGNENLLKKHQVREKTLEDGSKEIIFPNGNIKKVSPDNKIVRMLYYNGDIKEVNSEEGSEKYYYCETQTWHTTYNDGMEVLEFPTGQTERRFADGSSEISFPNGCVRYCDPSGRDEWRFLDGTVMKTDKNGHRILLMANGQKEIQTTEYKQREYPDGTIKILYSNGTQETRYASGRVRLKDGTGNLIMDSGGI